MNWIDIILIVYICITTYYGYKQGFISEMTYLAAFVTALVVAMKYSGSFSKWCELSFAWNWEYLPLVVFAVQFVLVIVSIYLILKFFKFLLTKIKLELLDHVMGSVFGFVKAVFIAGVILFIVLKFNEKRQFMSAGTINNSFLITKIAKIIPSTFPDIDYRLGTVNHLY